MRLEEKQKGLFRMIDIEKIKKCLNMVWTIDTCCPKYHVFWDKENNPSAGQCAVTALVVQDYFGGELWYCKHFKHYWNRINGLEIDLTIHQFPKDCEPCFDRIRSRNILLKEKNLRRRYELLKNLVYEYLKEI